MSIVLGVRSRIRGGTRQGHLYGKEEQKRLAINDPKKKKIQVTNCARGQRKGY
jgi:hypothetical protein